MKTILLLSAILLLCLIGCTNGQKSGKGFTLPDGDSSRGEVIFAELRCHECHTVIGSEFPELEQAAKVIPLGGEVLRIQTYGELVTSIINPSHKLASTYQPQDGENASKSAMKNYNAVMTVEQLIDLVAFLQSKYVLKPYEPTEYYLY